MLGSKTEGLPDNPSKPDCSFESQGCPHRLEILRKFCGTEKASYPCPERGVKTWLSKLTHANRQLDLRARGVEQVKEALEDLERLGDVIGQAKCFANLLAPLLHGDRPLDAAEQAASRAMQCLPKTGEEFLLSQCYRILGCTYRSKGEWNMAIHHFEATFGIASSFGWDLELALNHYDLAWLSLGLAEDEFDNATTHIEQAKSHVVVYPPI